MDEVKKRKQNLDLKPTVAEQEPRPRNLSLVLSKSAISYIKARQSLNDLNFRRLNMISKQNMKNHGYTDFYPLKYF